jgi:dienelactone hydrolase
MMHYCRSALVLLILALLQVTQVLAADVPLLGPAIGPHAVGYRVIQIDDPARSFGPRLAVDGKPTPRPLSRPVQIHLWYPAADTNGQRMLYRDYVLASNGPTGNGPGEASVENEVLKAYKARPLRRGADEARLNAILGSRMFARRDATPATGPFPLILYAPSINADPYENAVLFEYLASFGYVVAAAPSVGLQEPEVSIDGGGARAQLGDLTFVLGHVCEEPWVDQKHMGVLGFSWGGMTAPLFAIQHLGIDAIACLDGAATMPAYRPIAESFDWWTPRDLRAALLDIVLADEERDLRFGTNARYADVYAWRIPRFKHGEFSADEVAKIHMAAQDSLAAWASGSWGAIAGRLRVFFDAYLKGSAESLSILRVPGASVEGSTWTSRMALPAPPTAAQFDEIIETRGVETAAQLFHEFRARDPEVVIFDERRLLRFATSWGPERSKELLALMQLNLEAYPKSADTRFWLAQIHLELGDKNAAVRSLEEAIAIDPTHEKARRLLEKIR